MRLHDIVPQAAVIAPVPPGDRDDVIAQLLDTLIAAGVGTPDLRDTLLSRVLERERKLSTGFGRGVAVPHAKHPGIDRLGAAVAVSHRGVDFSSPDKQPVYIVFLLLSPEGRPEDHLRAMEAIFKHLSKDSFRRVLRQCQNPGEVWTVLLDADGQSLV